MSTESEKRYQEILKMIAERPPPGRPAAAKKPSRPQEQALEGLNAWQAFARLAQSDYARSLCYGPKALRGAAWAGIVLWYRRKGYHGYRLLHLLGAWTHYRAGELILSIGQRQLPYRAPVYEAGVYRMAIQNGFHLYYDDAGAPPTAAAELLYQGPYKAKERLQQRQRLAEILGDWRAKIEAL